MQPFIGIFGKTAFLAVEQSVLHSYPYVYNVIDVAE